MGGCGIEVGVEDGRVRWWIESEVFDYVYYRVDESIEVILVDVRRME